MPDSVTVVVNNETDARRLEVLAQVLRANNTFSAQIREFADIVRAERLPRGLNFQPIPGQILICHFGLGFQKPEIVKTRPVLVVSASERFDKGICTVIPISSKAPQNQRPYHYELPKGLVPNRKYERSWLKGDLVQTVGCHRLDRMKVGQRKYAAPVVPSEVLVAARRCILHSQGMHILTEHWK